NMLLAIDIGNTNITFGLFKKNGLVKVFDAATKNCDSHLFIRRKIGGCHNFSGAVICSVVPKKTKQIYGILHKEFGIKAKIIGKDIKVPIKNLYGSPKQVGQDRLVVAYACKKLYGSPAIIIDFGTAITFDYINKSGAYEGGVIAPGIGISLDALYENTALLPMAKFPKKTGHLIGKNTKESILSGATYGLFSMCDGLISAIKKHTKGKTKVIATGGAADMFYKNCKFIDKVDKGLILKGILLVRHCEER
ncbi:MAG: type III pantothenate kinase, partial [Candidatus Omnitrophica bacterium]|nr:type III pantothenate kinase [Candidatus Omnitrophota bacterium]